MPRYFFHVEDGSYIPDLEGIELPDLKTARDQMITMVGKVLNEGPEGIWTEHHWRMVVADSEGKILFTLGFTAR